MLFKQILVKTTAVMLVVVLIMGFGLTACTNSNNTTQPTQGTTGTNSGNIDGKTGEGKTVGLSIAMLSGNPFWQVLSDQLKSGFEKLGYKYEVFDGLGDVAKQTNDVEDMISRKFDMILINPFDSKAIVPVTLRAKEAKIPVIALDIDIDPSGYSESTIICDNKTIGFNLGNYAGSLFNKPEVRIILISGYPGGIDSYDRRMGFLEGIHKYQLEKFGRTGVQVLFHNYADYAFDPATKVAEDALVKIGNDFDLLYAENDAMAMGALKAIEENGKIDKKVIIGVDGWKKMYELIKEGKATATGLNSPTELGDLTVKKVHEFLNGVNIGAWNFTTPDVVDSKNVDKYYDPNSVF